MSYLGQDRIGQDRTGCDRLNFVNLRAEEATNPLKCFYGLGEGPCGPVCLKGPGKKFIN